MGWCSGTEVFDAIVADLKAPEMGLSKPRQRVLISSLIKILEGHDWDCHSDSRYFDDPLVQSEMKKLHPNWDWDTEDP